MIKPISLNFTGQVKIGRNREDRRKIASAIQKIPTYQRQDFITSLKILKSAIADNTPDNARYVIRVGGYDNGHTAATNISVTDDKLNKTISLSGFAKTENGNHISMREYDDRMKSAFHSAALNTINYSNNKITREEAPETKTAILNKLV